MSIFSNFADAPNQIKTEGQEITLTFQRIGNNRGKISWNIPAPANGCSAENRAYDGIVITVSNSPANYTTTSPKDGTYYTPDPTADKDAHVGDVIDSKAYVVGAFYHDTKTMSLEIDGVFDKTPYYVSGYAVDSVGRYHREGVHAYSIPTGAESYTTEDYPAIHEISIYSSVPLNSKSKTGLDSCNEYTIPLKMECTVLNFKVKGKDALTYGMLVDELNAQFSLIGVDYQGPLPKNAGSYFLDNGTVNFWTGYKIEHPNYFEMFFDPLDKPIGSYWLDNGTLKIYTATGWETVQGMINSSQKPSQLSSHDIWFDGFTVRVWEGNHWCDYNTIFSDTNPQHPPTMGSSYFWYNTDLNEFFQWNDVLKKWDDALVIYYHTDPNTLLDGEYWFDEKTKRIKELISSSWKVVTKTIYLDSDENGQFPDTAHNVYAGRLWLDTRLHKLYKRNLMNTAWEIQTFISFPTDPMDRKSCDIWWNSSPSIDDVYVWEKVSSTWVLADAFYQQSIDPREFPILPDHSAWVDDEGNIRLVDAQKCEKVNYIYSEHDPRSIPAGTIWFNGTHYYVYDGSQWSKIYVIKTETDPFNVTFGYLWFDLENCKLYRFASGMWEEICLHDISILPEVDELWYNSKDKILLSWNGTLWYPMLPYISVEFKPRSCNDSYEKLVFKTRKTGCYEEFEILEKDNTLLSSLTNTIIYGDPIDGSSGMDAGPMYKQLGVGDDGSPDERRKLHRDIRMLLGYPAVKAELTKQQIDMCIDNALLMLRKHSTYAYKRAMFFLSLRSNQQIYKLTNKCVGFNNIVDILALRRTKAGAFRTAYSQNDNFAYAALQQLYTLGTFDMLTYHMTASYVEELETLFASRIMYQWVERKRELRIYQVPKSGERILVEAIIERTEQELLNDRETAYWLQRWALNEAKGILAQLRGKFQTLPGPNGTTVLNANDLQAQVDNERVILQEELESKAMQDMNDVGAKGSLLIG